MGAEIELAAGYVKASAPKGRLTGGDYSFPVVSVGATENALMAAVLATGRTQLFNAAREPEIVDLCNLLVAMGAKIEGIGSGHLIIDGVEGLHGTTYEVMPDRIEAGSYACAAGLTGGSINLIGARPDEMQATLNALAQAGLIIEFHDKGIRVSANGGLKPLALSTSPFPGFATDMQAQFMAMLCRAEGQSFLEETIFENRYMHVPELRRMGAEVEIHGRSAVVHGVEKLTGAQVMATDLRASMSLVLAGLAAEGETEVLRVYHLDRGYERLEEKLSAVGATSSAAARVRGCRSRAGRGRRARRPSVPLMRMYWRSRPTARFEARRHRPRVPAADRVRHQLDHRASVARRHSDHRAARELVDRGADARVAFQRRAHRFQDFAQLAGEGRVGVARGADDRLAALLPERVDPQADRLVVEQLHP